MASSDDTRFMARALQLAKAARYRARPNPHVGCVLVRDGQIIGEGATQPVGGPHAEIEALNATADPRGATAYVTLEPCNHHGRTGPCAQALIEAGIRRVVYAVGDPGESSGGGAETLREAGIAVESGVLEAQARDEICGFLLRHRRGWGRLRLKLATSLDGRTAMASGDSRWITGAAARRDVHRLRAGSCAIVTGVNTVLADDCSLTVRDFAPDNPPLAPVHRVVLDSRLQTPVSARVVAADAPTTLLHGPDAVAPSYPESVALQPLAVAGDGRLELQAVLRWLGTQAYNEILVESGPSLAGALLEARLVDELIIYMAPVLLGSDAMPLVALPITEMHERYRLEWVEQRRYGDDWRLTFRVPGRD